MNGLYCLSGCPVNKRLHDHPPRGSGNLKLLKDRVTLILQGNRIAEISSMSSCGTVSKSLPNCLQPVRSLSLEGKGVVDAAGILDVT